MEKRLTLEEIKELRKQAKSLGFSLVMEEMLSDDELRERFASVYKLELDDPKRYEIMEEAALDLVMQYEDPVELEYLAANVVDTDLHEALAKAVLRNQDKLNCTLSSDQLSNIVVSVENTEFLEECKAKHEEYNIDEYGVYLIDTMLIYYQTDFKEPEEPSAEELIEAEKLAEQIQKEQDMYGDPDSNQPSVAWLDAYGAYPKGFYEPLPETDYDVEHPLDYSKAERFAIRVYEGVTPGGGSLGLDLQAYKTINAMNYPGISNELERIFDDRTVINPTAIFQTEELMQRSLDLYSVMYKYGQRMDRDRKAFRVDRASAAQLVYDTGRVVSNFSTSTTGYKSFSKADIALEEVVIRKGTPCADFKEVLGHHDYELATEAEILVAPGAVVTSEQPRPPQSQEELKMKNKSFGPASAVYVMTISPPEKPQELTEAEEEDVFKSSQFVFNEDNRKKAAVFIAKLLDLSQQGYSKQDVIQMMDSEDLKAYLDWKEAFQSVYQYRIRQIALKIDREVAAAKENGNPLYSETIPSYDVQDERDGENDSISKNPTIGLEEIEKMIKNQNLKDSMGKAKGLLTFLEKLKGKSGPDGEEKINPLEEKDNGSRDDD